MIDPSSQSGPVGDCIGSHLPTVREVWGLALPTRRLQYNTRLNHRFLSRDEIIFLLELSNDPHDQRGNWKQLIARWPDSPLPMGRNLVTPSVGPTPHGLPLPNGRGSGSAKSVGHSPLVAMRGSLTESETRRRCEFDTVVSRDVNLRLADHAEVAFETLPGRKKLGLTGQS